MPPPPRPFYQGKGLEPDEVRSIVLSLFERDPARALLIGPVCMEIGRSYNLNETETLLDQMVLDGLLRPATKTEVRGDHTKAYVLITSRPKL